MTRSEWPVAAFAGDQDAAVHGEPALPRTGVRNPRPSSSDAAAAVACCTPETPQGVCCAPKPALEPAAACCATAEPVAPPTPESVSCCVTA